MHSVHGGTRNENEGKVLTAVCSVADDQHMVPQCVGIGRTGGQLNHACRAPARLLLCVAEVYKRAAALEPPRRFRWPCLARTSSHIMTYDDEGSIYQLRLICVETLRT